MTLDSILNAGSSWIEATMLGLICIAVFIAAWMAIVEMKHAAHRGADDWDAHS